MAVGEDLAQRADLADRLEGAGLDDRQGLVQTHRLALLEDLDVDVGRARQPHLAARGEHVDGVVFSHSEKHPVTTGRLSQSVDLFAQGEQLLAGLFKSFHQLGVSRGKRVDAGLELVYVTGTAGTAVCGSNFLELLTQHGRFAP